MTDREALAAALGYADAGRIAVTSTENFGPLETLYAAARERLAQLPEKCEHGESRYHLIDGLIVNGSCPGKVYPPRTVEKIGIVTTDPRWSHIESPLLLEFALAVLDALARKDDAVTVLALEWAEGMAELDNSKTVSEWLEWLQVALTPIEALVPGIDFRILDVDD